MSAATLVAGPAGHQPHQQQTRPEPDQDVTFEVLPRDHAAVEVVEGWFRVYAAQQDPAVRERIILAYLGLADRLAERYRNHASVPLEDVRQTARLGLVKAVDRYDPDRPNPFVPYAVATVVGEIKRYLRDTSWQVRVPRSLKELSVQLCHALDDLPQKHGRPPSEAELAEHLDVTEKEVSQARQALQAMSFSSLDQQVGESNTPVGELIQTNTPMDHCENVLALPQVLGTLPEREQEIVRLRYVDELTQSQIAERIGMSQMHVSRLLRHASERMRTQLIGA